MRLVAYVFGPFVLAFLATIAVHIWADEKASDELAVRAVEICRGDDHEEKEGFAKRIDSALTQTLKEVNRPTESEPCPRDLQGNVRAHVHGALLSGDLPVSLLVQGFLLFLFPALFYAALRRAAKDARPIETKASDDEWKAPLDRSTSWEATLLDVAAQLRQQHFTSEEGQRRSLVVRVAFAIFAAAASFYLLHPAGVQASIMMGYTRLVVRPGEPSYPFMAEYFTYAPPYVVAFGGFFIHALSSLFSRALSRTLTHRLFAHLLRRALIVWLISVVLSGVTQGGWFTNSIVFIASVFPAQGVRLLGRLVQLASGGAQAQDVRMIGFRALPEIDISKESVLAEAGVLSMYDLAMSDWRELLKTGLNPILLVRAADRGLLVVTLGYDRAEKLGKLTIDSASAFVRYLEGLPEDHVKLAADAIGASEIEPIYESLVGVENVNFALHPALPLPTEAKGTRAVD